MKVVDRILTCLDSAQNLSRILALLHGVGGDEAFLDWRGLLGSRGRLDYARRRRDNGQVCARGIQWENLLKCWRGRYSCAGEHLAGGNLRSQSRTVATIEVWS